MNHIMCCGNEDEFRNQTLWFYLSRIGSGQGRGEDAGDKEDGQEEVRRDEEDELSFILLEFMLHQLQNLPIYIDWGMPANGYK